MEKQVITIDRSKWARAISDDHEQQFYTFGDTCLRNDKNNLCCLGFIAEALGVPSEVTFDKEMPCELNLVLIPLTEDDGTDSNLTLSAQKINDDFSLSPKEREKQLKKLFKDHFILKFVGRTSRIRKTDAGT